MPIADDEPPSNLGANRNVFPARPLPFEGDWLHFDWIQTTASHLTEWARMKRRLETMYKRIEDQGRKFIDDANPHERLLQDQWNYLRRIVVPLFDEVTTKFHVDEFHKYKHIRTPHDAEREPDAAVKEWERVRDVAKKNYAEAVHAWRQTELAALKKEFDAAGKKWPGVRHRAYLIVNLAEFERDSPRGLDHITTADVCFHPGGGPDSYYGPHFHHLNGSPDGLKDIEGLAARGCAAVGLRAGFSVPRWMDFVLEQLKSRQPQFVSVSPGPYGTELTQATVNVFAASALAIDSITGADGKPDEASNGKATVSTPQATAGKRKVLSELQQDVWKILERNAEYDQYDMPKKCLTGDEIADILAKDFQIRNKSGKDVSDIIGEIKGKGWPIENQRGRGYFIAKSARPNRPELRPK